VNKPNFTLENWQRQRVNEYLFLNCEQSAFELLSNSASTDADLVIAAIGVDAALRGDATLRGDAGENIFEHFHRDLAIPLHWLKDCIDYTAACLKDEH
jgi:hypothetical protein